MKLYATITSERATKGQGGNEFLEIEIKNEKRETILEFSIKPEKNGYKMIATTHKANTL